MIICINGAPKMGNHALLKTVELLGQNSQVRHIPYGDPLTEGATKHIFIKRDPRNALISWMRHNGKPVTQGIFMSMFSDYRDTAMSYAGWLHDTATYVVKFEDLIKDDTELRGIADFLGVPYLDDAFPNLPGWTITWTGKYSDYTTLWTPALEEFWQANGGQELLTAYGY